MWGLGNFSIWFVIWNGTKDLKIVIFKVTSCLLAFTLVTGCGASLRSPKDLEKSQPDALVQLGNELNQSAIVEEEKSQEATPTQLPIYKALTTEIPEGFCLSLAEKSAQLMTEIERGLGSNSISEGETFKHLILSSEKLVSWVSSRVPFVVANEIIELVSFYQDLARKLTSIDFENATIIRMQALLFSSLLSEDAVGVDSFLNASNQLGKYVHDSCGPGYPLLTTLSVLVSSTDGNELEKSQGVIKSFLNIWPEVEVENTDKN